jgi:hypothetical protein
MTQQYPQPSPYGQQPPPGWVPPGAVPDPRHWQGYGQPVPPSAPKRKRRWPWAVVAVLLLAVVIGSAAGKETPSSGAAPSVDEVAAPAEVASGSGNAAGDAVEQDGLRITAAPLRKVKPKYGDRLLCSRVTYVNIGDDEEFFNVINWKIQSPDGVQAGAMFAQKDGLQSGQLAPGGTVAGDVCRKDSGRSGEHLIIHEATFADPIRWRSTV